MLKNRFFNDDENVQVQDIWIYRILQSKIANTDYFRNIMVKLIYDLKARFDCPLFTASPALTYSDENNTQKWNKVMD